MLAGLWMLAPSREKLLANAEWSIHKAATNISPPFCHILGQKAKEK